MSDSVEATEPEPHALCRYRRRELRDGIEMDRCYAIGIEELGDLPCEYCVDERNQGGRSCLPQRRSPSS